MDYESRKTGSRFEQLIHTFRLDFGHFVASRIGSPVQYAPTSTQRVYIVPSRASNSCTYTSPSVFHSKFPSPQRLTPVSLSLQHFCPDLSLPSLPLSPLSLLPRFPRLCEFYNFENFTREFRNSFASSKLLSNATEDSLTRHLKLSAVDFAALSKHPSRDNIREL